jgi:hypothetical protein
MKLFLGLPIYSHPTAQFVQCLLALQANKPCEIELHVCQGDGVARSRNRLTAEFIRSDCSHMLQIDSDLIFSSEQIARIVSHDVPVVGGLYPLKQEGPVAWCVNTTTEQTEPDERGLQEVKYVGTGFMCVRRDAFEMIQARYPESRYVADYDARLPEFDFWPMGVYRPTPEDPGRYLSEDWYFCQRWIDLGGKVLADTKVILKHIGPAVFPLKTQEEALYAATKPLTTC